MPVDRELLKSMIEEDNKVAVESEEQWHEPKTPEPEGAGYEELKPVEDKPVESSGEVVADKSEPAKEGKDAPPTFSELSDEELANTFIKTKVYGEERKVSLKEIRDNYQIQEAAKSKLDEAKALVAEYKMLLEHQKKVQNSKPAEAPKAVEQEYVDPITAELNRVRQEIEAIKGFNQSQLTSTLQAKEDAEVARIIGEDKPDQVRAKILAVVEANPNFAPIASELFNGSPKSAEDMAKRIGFFDALYTKARTMNIESNLPQVVREAKEAGKEEGKREAKKELKNKLINVSGGTPSSEKSDYPSRLRIAASKGTDGIAQLLEERLFSGVK
jgi:hypothetical protein